MFIILVSFVLIPLTPIFGICYVTFLFLAGIFYGVGLVWFARIDEISSSCYEGFPLNVLIYVSFRYYMDFAEDASLPIKIFVGVVAALITLIGTVLTLTALVVLFASGIILVPLFSICVWIVLLWYQLRVFISISTFLKLR